MCRDFRQEIFLANRTSKAYSISLEVDSLPEHSTQTLKILAIGNSFSQDALEHLYHITKSAGFEKIVLANLYIGGCSLETHWENAKGNIPAYSYDKNSTGIWEPRENSTLLYGLQDEAWDIITMQQVSGLSGVANSYHAGNHLAQLISYVHKHKTNPHVRLAWHMTWAYDQDCPKESFARYGNDQLAMYNSIIAATQGEIVGNKAFSALIPTGTAIQNARNSEFGHKLTRDGFDLSLNLGRYIAGLTWFRALTGLSIDDLSYVPSNEEVPPRYLASIRKAVNSAIEAPFAITT